MSNMTNALEEFGYGNLQPAEYDTAQTPVYGLYQGVPGHGRGPIVPEQFPTGG